MLRSEVVIVGAGAAGLACGRVLADAGAAVTIVEARERIGGRMSTFPSAEEPLELGAQVVHATADPSLMDALAAEGLITRPLAHGVPVTLLDGDRRLGPGDLRERSILPPWVVERHLTGRAGGTVADELLALTGQARRVAAAWLEQSMGDSCSALDAREAVRFRDARTIGPERTIEGGFGELAARLARGLEVRLGSPVRRIERGSWTRVELATGERIAAETVVVTVPPSVLGQGGLYLGEVLPDDKREAARVLRSCDAMSIVVRTEHTADRAAWTLVVEPLAGLWQLRPGQRWVLGVAKGSAAAGLRELAGDRQRLQRMIGLVAPQLGRVEEVVSCDWGRDPWSRGGFSTAIVGGEDAARAWATPIGGRVFFAGEATADRSGRGLVQGALTSGRRAAEEVLARHDR